MSDGSEWKSCNKASVKIKSGRVQMSLIPNCGLLDSDVCVVFKQYFAALAPLCTHRPGITSRPSLNRNHFFYFSQQGIKLIIIESVAPLVVRRNTDVCQVFISKFVFNSGH